MRKYFQNQTGVLLFSCDLTASRASGEAQINFGQEGVSGKAMSFNLKDGNLTDSDGVCFGSYLPNKPFNISGAICENDGFYFYNGAIARSSYARGNSDIDYIELEKSTGDESSYDFSYSVIGKDHAERSLIYISNSGAGETGILKMISGMSLFGEISEEYSDFTGMLSEDALDSIAGSDLIIFGQYVKSGDFSDLTGWAKIETPIVLLDMATAKDLDLIDGEFSASRGQEKTWGISDGNPYSEIRQVRDSIIRRGDADGYSRYELFLDQNLIFLTPTTAMDAHLGEILFNDAFKRTAVVEFIEAGSSGFRCETAQSGNRYLFNCPNSYTGTLFDGTTDNWKKIFLSSIYDAVETKSEILPLASSSSSSISSESSSSSSRSSSKSSSSVSSSSSSQSSSSVSSSKSSSSESSSSSNSSSSISSSANSSSSSSSGSSGSSVGNYVVDFEGDEETKISYDYAPVYLSGYPWILHGALIGTSVSDKKNGKRSLRITMAEATQSFVVMDAMLENGISRLSFNYAAYGTDTNQGNLAVVYSQDGTTWIPITILSPPYPSSLTAWDEIIPDLEGEVKIGFFAQSENISNSRINIDDITIYPY